MKGESAGTMPPAVLDRYGPPEVVRIAKVCRPPSQRGELGPWHHRNSATDPERAQARQRHRPSMQGPTEEGP
jgi:hypothetical protein